MLSENLYCSLVILIALQRSAELRVSKRNDAYLQRLGAVEHSPGHFVAKQLLHGTWLASCLLEVKFSQTAARRPTPR